LRPVRCESCRYEALQRGRARGSAARRLSGPVHR
jgi:hypothetical protein